MRSNLGVLAGLAAGCVLLGGCSGSDPGPSPTPSLSTPDEEGPRFGASHVLLPDPDGSGLLLVNSPPEGFVDRGPLDLWEYDGTWAPLVPTGEWPSARSFFAAGLDPVRGVVVVHGGEGAEATPEETWEWDGETWTRVADGPGEPLGLGSFAYDEARGALLLHGGMTGHTWTWDGSEWADQGDRGPQPPRWPAAMVSDGAGGVVLMGGHQVDPDLPEAIGDTWAWSDGTWTEQRGAGGPGRQVNAGAVVHPDLGPLLVSTDGDVHRWTGERWEVVGNGTFPPAEAFGLGWDDERGVLVRTGGIVEPGASARRQDVWEWSGDPSEDAVRVLERPAA